MPWITLGARSRRLLIVGAGACLHPFETLGLLMVAGALTGSPAAGTARDNRAHRLTLVAALAPTYLVLPPWMFAVYVCHVALEVVVPPLFANENNAADDGNGIIAAAQPSSEANTSARAKAMAAPTSLFAASEPPRPSFGTASGASAAFGLASPFYRAASGSGGSER